MEKEKVRYVLTLLQKQEVLLMAKRKNCKVTAKKHRW